MAIRAPHGISVPATSLRSLSRESPGTRDDQRCPASPTCLLGDETPGQGLCKWDLLTTEKGLP